MDAVSNVRGELTGAVDIRLPYSWQLKKRVTFGPRSVSPRILKANLVHLLVKEGTM